MLINEYSRLFPRVLKHEMCALCSETLHSFTVTIYGIRFLRIHDRSKLHKICTWRDILLVFS